MNVVEKIKNAMELLGKKPASVANDAGISVSDFYGFLAGKKDMNRKTIEKVFRVLNIDLVIQI